MYVGNQKLSNNKKALLEKAKNKFILMKTKEVAPKKTFIRKKFTHEMEIIQGQYLKSWPEPYWVVVILLLLAVRFLLFVIVINFI